MAETVYLLCAAASLLCAVLLHRGYARSRAQLLLWSCLCFYGLTLNNVLLFVDLVVVPQVDLSVWRAATALAALLALLTGLIWGAK